MWRVRALLSWLREPCRVYFAVVYIVLAVAIIYACGLTESAFRITGGALQVMGLGTVIWGITETRKQFGHAPALKLTVSWFRRFPLIRRPAFLRPDGITVGASITGMRLTSVFTPKPDVPLQERLAVIEKGILTVQQRIADAESQMDKGHGEADGKIAAEAHARERGDKDLLRQLEAASTGGVYISIIGTLWLFAGLVLSTASPELATYLG